MEISNVSDFVTNLKSLKNDKRYEFFFRGHSDCNYSLKPSIYRGNFINNEDKIYREIILRVPNDFFNEETTIEKLVKMQHYSLPTRLLDITSNPLVALYFACSGNDSKDGEIIIFKVPKEEIKFYDSDTVTILANLAKRPSDFDIDVVDKTSTKSFNEDDQILKLLHEIRSDKSHFLPLIDFEDLNKVIAVKVKLNNNRIIKQSGAFLLFGIKNNKTTPAEILPDWILSPSKLEIKINSKDKSQILNELNRMEINESTLFPEFEYQAKHIKNLYK